jgi:uncharacterized protein (DUF2225 family)
MTSETASRISFFSKSELACPVCDTKFYREDILTGRGRLIAGELSTELRRYYEPSQKYGEVYPLIYPVTVCPGCYYAVFSQDFDELHDDGRREIENDTDDRVRSVQKLFEDLDYREPRRLEEGSASYYLAMRCYDSMPSELSPTIKQGVSAIRAAWLCADLHRRAPEENYDYLSRIFYRKARFFYTQAIEYEQNGEEAIANAGNLGPDIDKNYGYDGVLYLAAYLEYHHGPTADEIRRHDALQRSKTIVAKLFGMGKASRQKPSAILELSRDLYAEIRDDLDEDDEVDETME